MSGIKDALRQATNLKSVREQQLEQLSELQLSQVAQKEREDRQEEQRERREQQERKDFIHVSPDAEIRKTARRILQDKDGTFLGIDGILTIIELFGSDTEASQTYLNLNEDILRRRWLQNQLEKVGRKGVRPPQGSTRYHG